VTVFDSRTFKIRVQIRACTDDGLIRFCHNDERRRAIQTVSWTFSIHIHVKPEEAFAYVADLTRHGEWGATPLKVEAVSSAPVMAGSQYRSIGHMMGRDIHNDLQVTDYQTSSRFAFAAKSRMGEFRHEFTFQPQAGGTLVIRTVSAFASPLRKLLYRLIDPVTRPMNEKALQVLKAQLEQIYAKEDQLGSLAGDASH
jgi:Polyketide cyclase / dehydrase and lipid transport